MANKVYKSLANVMQDIKAIGKDQQNTHQRYNYRGIDDLYNALQPILAKHGIHVCVFDEELVDTERTQSNGKYTVGRCYKYTMGFAADDGSISEPESFHGEAMDFGDKATSKAQSMAMKYWLLRKFMIPTEEQDPDGQTYERGVVVQTEQQVDPKVAYIQFCKKIVERGDKEKLQKLGIKDKSNPTAAEMAAVKKLYFTAEG